MLESILIPQDSKYFNSLVQLTETVERDHNIKVLCSALFSSIPMGLDTVTSDVDVFMLALDIKNCEKLKPNIQFSYDAELNLLKYLTNPNYVDAPITHKVNDKIIVYDVCINDIFSVNSSVENYKCIKYPSYHNTTSEDHIAEGNKKFIAQERSSRIFIQRMLVHRNIWDKNNYLSNNWNEIQKKHLKSIEIMDMWYTTSRGHADFTLTKEKVQLRKYLNMMYSLLAIKWINRYNTLPPIKFTEIIEECNDIEIKEKIMQLYSFNKKQTEIRNKVFIDNIPLIKDYYLNEILLAKKFIEELYMTDPDLCLKI